MRELFATAPEARIRGYKPGRFSFNVKGGRCEACSGDGYNQIEMQFLPDVTVPCEVCNGARYNREALEIRWKGKNIAEVLSMTVTEALEHFSNIPRIRNKLQTMYDVGLGYIRLGQPATTLSGGEAQRVKLATELSKRATGQTLYILDEPTTGLSFEDCAYLLRVLHRLVDAGNTVVLIEHHLDLIKSADWLIDLGPARRPGGEVVAVGAPRDLGMGDRPLPQARLRRRNTGRASRSGGIASAHVTTCQPGEATSGLSRSSVNLSALWQSLQGASTHGFRLPSLGRPLNQDSAVDFAVHHVLRDRDAGRRNLLDRRAGRLRCRQWVY